MQHTYKRLSFQKLVENLWEKSLSFKIKMPKLASSLEIHTHEKATPIQEETKDKPKTLQVVYRALCESDRQELV